MSTAPMPKVQLYAELLANILQTRLFVTIQCSPQPKPSISLDLDSSLSAITVSYNSEKFSLQLPSRVSESAQHAIKSHTADAVHSNGTGQNEQAEFSFRLSIAAETRAAKERDAMNACYGIQVPWTAKDMSPQTNIRCRACLNPIFVPQHDVNILWKDLPSSDWAEMMDLWHCHKPDAPQTAEDENVTNIGKGDGIENVKGYGAANSVACSPGTVFVNVTSFIVAESDCQGLKKRVRFFFLSQNTLLYLLLANTLSFSGCSPLLHHDRAERRRLSRTPWTNLRYNCPILKSTLHYSRLGFSS